MADLLNRIQQPLGDRYTIEGEIGRGGMAVVYRALDLKHNRPVAVKVLRPDVAAALGPERFLREIEIAARLTHPHILALHDSGEAGGLLYYVMPFVAGESLRDRLTREGQLPVDEALNIARHVASALSYAHSHDVVHRDIKPENILLQGDEVLVADFGIARAITVAGGERLTSTGIAVGTPAYMSPEQGAGEARPDGRSDLFSLGCVLYEMLAGTPPFAGPTAQVIQARRMADPVPPLRTVRVTVPPHVERAIVKALAKVPADRFATAAEFAEALTTAGPAAGRWWRPAPPSSKRLALGSVLTVGVVGAIVVARAHRPYVMPSASVIAVLPFMPSISDTALSRLGRDLVVTVSATLDQVGELRTVDRYNILSEVDGATPYSLNQGAALSRRLGAGSFVLGSLVRDGGGVRLDIGMYRTDTHTPLGPVIVVRASPDSLTALSDSITWALLRQLWQRGTPPTPSLGAVTTRSIPALRAFLDAERAMQENHWPDAAEGYARAIAADSTFWLAYWRHALARWWSGAEPDERVLAVVRSHRAAFPEREQLLFEAWASESLSLELTRWARFTERFPGDWLGWWLYGDKLSHDGPLLGHTSADARAALERALDSNPQLKPAWIHLFAVSRGQDTAAAARALGRFLHDSSRAAARPWFRLVERLGRTSGRLDPSLLPLADTVVRILASPPEGFLRVFGPVVMLDFPATQLELDRRVLRLQVAPDVAAATRRGVALAWAARGGWDSALVAMDEYARQSPGGTAAVERYRFAVVGTWLGANDPREAQQRRAAAVRAIQALPTSPSPSASQAELAWLDGVLAVVRRDRAALASARESVRRTSAPAAAILDQSLGAFDLELSGNRGLAAQTLAGLEWRRADRDDGSYDSAPYLTAVDRIAGARLLAMTGDTAQAVRLLTWVEQSMLPRSAEADVVAGLVYLERARIADAQGQYDLAREYYTQFLRRYDAPVPAFRQPVEEASAALARLEGRAPEEVRRRP